MSFSRCQVSSLLTYAYGYVTLPYACLRYENDPRTGGNPPWQSPQRNYSTAKANRKCSSGPQEKVCFYSQTGKSEEKVSCCCAFVIVNAPS
jgi:hypothetical protein